MSAITVPIVTIDGPSSSGKGTISRIVASRVGWQLLDSGALYRLVALGGILKDLDPDDVEQHVAIARSMRVEFTRQSRACIPKRCLAIARRCNGCARRG